MFQITLKAARINVGLSQREAAKALKVSTRTLIKWEQGVTYPRTGKLNEICALYGVPVEFLKFLPSNTL